MVVSVDNSANDFVYPQNADFTFYGGIYRDVKIVSVEKNHFDLDFWGTSGIKVTPIVDGTNAEVTVDAYVTGNGDVWVTIQDARGKLVDEAKVTLKDHAASVTFKLENAHLWNGVKDAFYAYQAWLSDKPMVHICGKRYVDRVEDVTKVMVYSNQPEVELFANGESVGKQQKGKYPFFYFEVKNADETKLTVRAGELTDESVIKKVDTFNEDYRLKEEGDVINWFEITTPTGYFSVNDTLGDIMSTFRGKIFLARMLMLFLK